MKVVNLGYFILFTLIVISDGKMCVSLQKKNSTIALYFTNIVIIELLI